MTIDALDVGGSRAPAELATLAFDDPELVTRYDRVLDYALDQLPDPELSALFLASASTSRSATTPRSTPPSRRS